MLQHFIYRMCVWEWQNGSRGEIELIFVYPNVEHSLCYISCHFPPEIQEIKFLCIFNRLLSLNMKTFDLVLCFICAWYFLWWRWTHDFWVFDFRFSMGRSPSRITRHQWLFKIHKELLVCFKIHVKGKSDFISVSMDINAEWMLISMLEFFLKIK